MLSLCISLIKEIDLKDTPIYDYLTNLKRRLLDKNRIQVFQTGFEKDLKKTVSI